MKIIFRYLFCRWLNLLEDLGGMPEDILRKVYLFNDICRGYQIGYTEMNC